MNKLSNLQLRIVSAVVLGSIVIAVTYLGGMPFRILAVIMGAAIFVEWRSITNQASNGLLVRLSELLLVLSFALLIAEMPPVFVFGGVALAALAGVIAAIFGGATRWLPIGIIYAGVPAACLAFLRGNDGEGLFNVLVLFGLVWATDIMAYFVGRAFGGPKLAPSISPNKTWSGAIGGAASAVAVGVIIAMSDGYSGNPLLPVFLVIISAISQGGDLFESWVKRKFGVKDSGKIIPGHGGMMDRVDGLVAAATALYGTLCLLSLF